MFFVCTTSLVAKVFVWGCVTGALAVVGAFVALSYLYDRKR